MRWVSEELAKRAKAVAPSAPPKPTQPQKSDSEKAWDVLKETMTSDVLQFNDARGPQYMVSDGPEMLQVIPKQAPLDTVVVQFDRTRGVVSVSCPIDHPGTPRRGTFRIVNGNFLSQGDFVGEPGPGSLPMSAADFSRFILKPVLFPG